MVQTTLSTQTKVLLITGAALASGLAAYGLGYVDYDWRLNQNSPDQVNQQQMQQQNTIADQNSGVQVAATQPTVQVTTDPRLPDAYAGQPYQVQLNSNAGPNVLWYLEQGALPAGLKLDENRGIISGMSNQLGTSIFRLKVVPGNGMATSLAQFTLNVVGTNGADASQNTQTTAPQAKITTEGLPQAQVGRAYEADFQATGDGENGINRIWRLQGDAPPGLTLNAKGELVGTPTQAGNFLVSVVLTTANVGDSKHTYDITRQYMLAIDAASADPKKPDVIQTPAPQPTPETKNTNPSPAPLMISGGYPDGGVGGYFSSQPLTVSGGQAPYDWSIASGNVPTGLYFSPNSVIAGYANQYGIFTFVVQVRDQAGNIARAERTIHIRPAQPVVSATIDPDLSNRLRRIDLIGVQVHDLIKLQDDGDPNTQYDTTVYYIGADGRRHSFPNPKVYFSWFPDFSRVRIVAPNELADIPLGANITYRPGTRLVKFMTDPRVYAVDAGRTLRWVKTEGLANSFYGAFWARQVDDISDAFYMDYRFGQDISVNNDYSVQGAQHTAAYPSDVLPQ